VRKGKRGPRIKNVVSDRPFLDGALRAGATVRSPSWIGRLFILWSPAKSNRAFAQIYPHRSGLRVSSQRNRTICLAPSGFRKYSIGND
jgi:hypothetical protein